MKLLCFVDLHGSSACLKRLREKAKKERPDVVVCAGDLTVFEQHIDLIVGMIADLKLPVFVVPGNHEEEDVLRKVCSYHKNLFFIHKRVQEFNGIVFVGFGGSGFSTKDPEFEAFAKGLPDFFGKKVVLVTHAPPYGTKLDLLGRMHYGNKSIASFVKKCRPALHVCGHFHETAGREDFVGGTRIINPGPNGKIVVIEN